MENATARINDQEEVSKISPRFIGLRVSARKYKETHDKNQAKYNPTVTEWAIERRLSGSKRGFIDFYSDIDVAAREWFETITSPLVALANIYTIRPVDDKGRRPYECTDTYVKGKKTAGNFGKVSQINAPTIKRKLVINGIDAYEGMPITYKSGKPGTLDTWRVADEGPYRGQIDGAEYVDIDANPVPETKPLLFDPPKVTEYTVLINKRGVDIVREIGNKPWREVEVSEEQEYNQWLKSINRITNRQILEQIFPKIERLAFNNDPEWVPIIIKVECQARELLDRIGNLPWREATVEEKMEYNAWIADVERRVNEQILDIIFER